MSLPDITKDTMEESLMYVEESIYKKRAETRSEFNLNSARLKLLDFLIKQERGKPNPRFP